MSRRTDGGQCRMLVGDVVVVRGGRHSGRHGVVIAVASAHQRRHVVRLAGSPGAVRVSTAFVHHESCPLTTVDRAGDRSA